MPSCVRKMRGFVFIELIVVISLAATLATVATPIFIDIQNQIEERSEQTLASGVQTGITLRQLENLMTQGLSSYPEVLDNAAVGAVASPATPFFGRVLHAPLTQGWRKEGEFRYRSPRDVLYVYDPEKGTFTPDESSLPPETNAGEDNPLQNIINQLAGMLFYDSGAIIDSDSLLSYIPSEEGVALTLASGTKIQTREDGSAIITRENGEPLTVSDIQKGEFFNFSPTSNSPDEFLYESLWVEGGQAGEASGKTTYLKRDYESRSDGGAFNYEYMTEGESSGGSLQRDYGSIYRSEYQSEEPQKFKGSWRKDKEGNIEGEVEQEYQYISESRYAYNDPESESNYGFSQTGKTEGSLKTNYSYDAATETYSYRYTGSHQYQINTEATFGDSHGDVAYDYEGSSEYNRKNQSYRSEMRYRYQDGRDITYQYERDEEGFYEWVMTDNKTGEKQKHTNKKKDEKKEDEDRGRGNDDDDEGEEREERGRN